MKKTKKETECLLQLDGAIYFVEKVPGRRAKKTELNGESVLRLVERAIAEYAEKELQKIAFEKAWQDWRDRSAKEIEQAKKLADEIEFELTRGPDEFSPPPR